MQFHLIVNNIPAESAIFLAKNANEVIKLHAKTLFSNHIGTPQPMPIILQAGFKIRRKATFSNYFGTLFSSFSRPIQPDIVEEHLAGTAGDSRIAPGSKSDCNPVDIG